MKGFEELFKTRFKEMLVILLVTNMLTGMTTSSKRVIKFLYTPISNRENITDLKIKVDLFDSTLNEMNAKFDAILDSQKITYKSKKDSIFVYNTFAYLTK